MGGTDKWVKGLLIFTAMVAAPLIVRATLRGGSYELPEWNATAPYIGYSFGTGVLAVFALFATIVGIVVFERLDRIAVLLKLAERDLNSLMSSAFEHGGRKGKVQERSDWLKLTKEPEVPVIQPMYSQPANKTVALEFFELNEKDLAGKGSAAGKASISAFLLRELYEGNVEAAQKKVLAETKNNDNKPPYIAPGIRELIGFDRFTPEHGFEEGAGVAWFELLLAVQLWRFPRNIYMVRTSATGQRTAVRNRDVIRSLTMQQV